MVSKKYSYYAFISYSHEDKRISKRIHLFLEWYRLPSFIQNELDAKQHYLRPIFRDEDELSSGVLEHELSRKLQSSKYLIVLCSPHSEHSAWVNNEINFFIQQGGYKRIIPILLSSADCLPSALKEYQLSQKEELLAIPFTKNRYHSLVRVVSAILNIDFSVLWNRFRRKRVKWIAGWSGLGVGMSILLLWLAVPLSFSIDMQDESHHLPQPDTYSLVVENTEYELTDLQTQTNVSFPGYLRGRNVHIQMHADFYQSIDTTITLNFWSTTRVILSMQRDSTFGVYAGFVIDREGVPIAGAKVRVLSSTVYTDSMGYYHLFIPIWEQSLYTPIQISKNGYHSYIREDNVASKNAIITLNK